MNRYALRQAASGQLLQSVGDKVSGKVLDVGCANMPYKRLFPHLDWTGLDVRPVADVEADAQAIPFEDETFDTVVCADMLQYVEDPALAVREMARILRSGGTLILTCPCCAPEEEGAMWGFHTSGLQHLVNQAGFTDAKVMHGGDQFESEFRNYLSTFKWGTALPEGFDGFLGVLEKDYPFYFLLVATK